MKRKFAIRMLAVLVGCIILALLIYRPVLNGMAQYLVYPDARKPSDFIVLLGGETDGQRTRKAVELYKEGLAPKIIVSSGARISWRTTESKEMVALLKQLHVPERDIILEQKSRSTYENALYTKKTVEGQTLRNKRLTLVTDDWHTRRSVYVFRQVFDESDIEICSVGSHSLEKVQLTNWWQDHESMQTILSEWARLIVYVIKY
ncbi:YdcF family protein [Aneurinibacillus migulanus]|uniref:YdcF family protein n=1 Tax=Aneurinibacillus migulanus TaxID=47500 RepID=UPI002E24A030|nr:YdcF family protein [Aneurinibacillus migulanus]